MMLQNYPVPLRTSIATNGYLFLSCYLFWLTIHGYGRTFRPVRLPEGYLWAEVYDGRLYSIGVLPVSFLNRRLKCWEYWNPSS